MTLITGTQLKAARVLLGVTQRQVAALLAVSVDTVRRAEADHPGSHRTKHQMQGMLRRNGFTFEAGGVQRALAAGAEYRAWLQRWT